MADYKCLLCHRAFTRRDADHFLFFPDTSICHDCYEDGQKKPHSGVDGWCFGKRTIDPDTKKVQWGYDPKAVDCGSVCPDRRWCPLYVSGDIYQLQQKAIADQTDESRTTEETDMAEKKEASKKAKNKKLKKGAAKKVKKERAPRQVTESEASPDVNNDPHGNPYAGRPHSEGMARIFDALVAGPVNLKELSEQEGLKPAATRSRLCADGAGKGHKYVTQRWTLQGRSDGVSLVFNE